MKTIEWNCCHSRAHTQTIQMNGFEERILSLGIRAVHQKYQRRFSHLNICIILGCVPFEKELLFMPKLCDYPQIWIH